MKKHNVNYTIENLLEVMAALRNPDGGCPWDLEQSFDTIAPYTIEEAYEVADAIARGATGDELADELGDLLLQVVYHARLAEETSAFSFTDVVARICDKMIRRHPHVFGDESIGSAAEQTLAWEAMKAGERAASRPAGVLEGIALALPALMRAAKLGRRAAKVGFDWPDVTGVRAKVREELAELDEAVDSGTRERIEAEAGDLLFAVANLCRHLDIDPEQALRGANRRFESRFGAIERAVTEAGGDWSRFDMDALERLWQAAKRSAARDAG
jgi:nucleoside triphosphate diphosphatase